MAWFPAKAEVCGAVRRLAEGGEGHAMGDAERTKWFGRFFRSRMVPAVAGYDPGLLAAGFGLRLPLSRYRVGTRRPRGDAWKGAAASLDGMPKSDEPCRGG